jgi:hypothetical protein
LSPSLSRLLCVLAAAGCTFDPSGGASQGDGGPPDPGDGGADAGGDGGSRCQGWEPTVPFDPCAIPLGEQDLILDLDETYTYDSDSGVLTNASGDRIEHDSALIDGDTVRVISVARLQIAVDAVLRFEGSLPIIIAAWQPAEIFGTIDASSSEVGGDGAGANPAVCDGTGPNPGESLIDTPAGGGGGGGFGGAGGPGGRGGTTLGGLGGRGGDAIVDKPGLRGGCPGARGGAGVLGGDQAARGSGGGAVAVSARLVLDVQGTIHAGGGGGLGAASGTQSGGGGAGSGGLIWLDAPTITLDMKAVLAANGGGGGEGSDSNDNGNPGDPGLADDGPAEGGRNAGNGGNGGNGSDWDTPDGTMGATGGGGGDAGGGGGGGGGAGLILIDGAVGDDGAVISPPETDF